jgi:hypothetical protein
MNAQAEEARITIADGCAMPFDGLSRQFHLNFGHVDSLLNLSAGVSHL